MSTTNLEKAYIQAGYNLYRTWPYWKATKETTKGIQSITFASLSSAEKYAEEHFYYSKK